MKLFKRDRDNSVTSIQPSHGSTNAFGGGDHGVGKNTPFMQKTQSLQSKMTVEASFPHGYDEIRQKAPIFQEGNVLLASLLKELAQLGDAEDFQSIMRTWGAGLAEQIALGCRLIQSEERFSVLCTYLNELLLLHRLGTFECSVQEQNHSLGIHYHFTNLDRHLSEVYGDFFWLSFYGELFRVMMNYAVEADLQLETAELTPNGCQLIFRG